MHAGDAYLSVDLLLLATLTPPEVGTALQEAGATRQALEDAVKEVGEV